MLKIRFKNKKYSAVWLVEPSISIGRDRSNPLVVSAPNVADKHLIIEAEHEALRLINLVPGSEVKVNGRVVEEGQPLSPRDTISLAGVELEIIDPKDESTAEPVESTLTNPRAPKATGWALKANHTALGNRVYPLKSSNLVGRSSESDISLAAAHLSRRHAELSVIDGVLYVRDLGSANGTYLNGKPVTEARVKRGDELRFDTLSFGVIGPADDMAKTTVRAVGKSQGMQPSRPSVGRTAKPAPPLRAETVTASPAPSAHKPRYGTAGLAVLIALTAIVVVALFLTRS